MLDPEVVANAGAQDAEGVARIRATVADQCYSFDDGGERVGRANSHLGCLPRKKQSGRRCSFQEDQAEDGGNGGYCPMHDLAGG